ncbi:FkbM family methyltransferase [Flavobacterium sp. GB2R13]|uniref:FkbM family methyltransferase n=1 Tax=Flavobacterium algoris TaxID=3398733 RepID=UPI003A895685
MENNYLDRIRREFLVQKKTAFRFGSIEDGGYYISPNNCLEADILFSGGISSNMEFEYDMFRFNKKLQIIMVDPTVSRSKLLVKAILRFFLFKREKLRYFINTLIFILMLRSGRAWHVKKWLSCKTGILDSIKEKIVDFESQKILLKLDIEGSEYDLLDEILTHIHLFNCMVFEFHDLDNKHTALYDFLKKCSVHFDIIHLEVNPSGGFSKNDEPKVIELSLERRF